MSLLQLNCIFCNIANGKDPSTTLVFENNNIVIFKDIHPASKYHYLAVPKNHVDDAKCLTAKDTNLSNY